MNEKCILCQLGYKVPAVRTELVDSFFVNGQKVRLCEFHDRLYYEWSTEKDHQEMRRLMSQKMFGRLKQHKHETEE